MLAPFGLVATRKPKIDQGIETGVGHGKDMTATSAVTAIGAAELFVFFVTKRHAAIAAIACGNVNDRFVDKFHVLMILNDKAPTSGALPAGQRWFRPA